MSAVVEAGNENKNGGRSQKNKKRHKFVEAHSNQSGTRKTGQHGRTQKKMKPSRNKNDRRWALPGVGHRHTIRHPSSADAVRIVRRPSFVFCLFFFCFFLHLDKSIAIRHPRRLTILIDNSFSLSLSLSLSSFEMRLDWANTSSEREKSPPARRLLKDRLSVTSSLVGRGRKLMKPKKKNEPKTITSDRSSSWITTSPWVSH